MFDLRLLTLRQMDIHIPKLEGLTGLTSLAMDQCMITVEGIGSVCSVLPQMPFLRDISIEDNMFGDEGMETLARHAMFLTNGLVFCVFFLF